VRTRSMRLAGLVSLVALLVGTFPGAVVAQNEVDVNFGTLNVQQRILDKVANEEPLEIVLSIQGTCIPIYAIEMQSGFERGVEGVQDRYPVNGRFVGPCDTDAAAQVAELEALLNANQVDCVGVQSPGPEAFVRLFDSFAEAGVPLFAVNTDVAEGKRLAYWALNELETGRALAREAARIIEERGLDVSNAVLFSSFPQAPWARDRMQGFSEELPNVLPGVQLVNDVNTAIDTTGDFAETRRVTDAYIQGQDIDLIFHTDQGVEEVGSTISDLGRAGSIFAVGMNASPKIFDLVDEGIILNTINQRWDLQTERLATECLDFLLDGKVFEDPLQYMPPDPVTPETIEAQRALWDELHPAEA
jgi:ABC-type sugar transport system substrate-binding protein